MDLVYTIIIILIFAIAFEKIMEYFKLPSIIGYLLAGIIIGPFVLKLITIEQVNNLEIISPIALTFISFSIGAELKIKLLRKLGKKPFIISLICAVITDVVIVGGLLVLGCNASLAIVLGAIGAATAPAIIMVIIKEYKASGKLTSTLLSIVAIDDVISIILFGFSLAIATNIENNTMNIIDFIKPFIEIGLSIVLGVIFGLSLGLFSKKINSDSGKMGIIVVNVLLLIFITELLNISPLLVSMISGFVFINIFNKKLTDKLLKLTDYITPLLLIIFFTLSGSSLDFNLLKDIGLIGLFYIILRIIGKIIGAKIGLKIAKEKDKSLSSLGICMFSQTGLSIGLVVIAIKQIPSLTTLSTIILGSSLIFDIISPVIIKNILRKNANIIEQ